MKITRTSVAAILFLIVLVWWGTADAEGTGQIEIGPSQVGSNFSTGGMLTITERFQDKYDVTIGYITEQTFSVCSRPDCTWLVNEQIFVGVDYLITSPWTDRLRLGLGPYYFQNADRVGTTNFRMGLSVEWRLNSRWGLRARHFSNAGSGPVLCIDRPVWGEICNDWNTGQDSWFRIVRYF
jgi:hypothetical protein